MDGMSFSDSGQQYSIRYSTVRSSECKFTNRGDMQGIQQPSKSSEWMYLKKKRTKMFQFSCSGRWNRCISSQLQLCTATREQSTQQEEGSCALTFTRRSKFNDRHAKHTTALISKLRHVHCPINEKVLQKQTIWWCNWAAPYLVSKRVPKNNQKFRDNTKTELK